MTDREMLEFAAKAAGVEVEWRRSAGAYYYDCEETGREEWNPLYHDGQALRLAVKLSLHVRMWVYACEVETKYGVQFGLNHCGDFDGDIGKATRYAITRAAAEIGNRMP